MQKRMKDNDKAKDAQSAKKFTGALHASPRKGKVHVAKSSAADVATELAAIGPQLPSRQSGSRATRLEDGAGAKEGVPATAAQKQHYNNELLDSAQRMLRPKTAV